MTPTKKVPTTPVTKPTAEVAVEGFAPADDEEVSEALAVIESLATRMDEKADEREAYAAQQVLVRNRYAGKCEAKAWREAASMVRALVTGE